MRALPALAVAALLVLAGCAAPSSPTTGDRASPDRTTADEPSTQASTTTTEGDAASESEPGDGVSDGGASDDSAGDVPPPSALAVNDTATFRNLTAMLDVDATKPTLDTRNLSAYFQSRTTTRQRLLGLTEYVERPEDDPHGLATSRGRIYVQPAGAPPPIVEQVVVHEQFHSIQFQQGWTTTRRPTTTDGRLATSGAVEGASVWITGEYTERYQRDDVPQQVRVVRDAVRNGPDGWRLFRAPYYFGARWTAHHIEDPANVSWVYANPPETTEQLMHNLTASEEPAKPIGVAVRSDRWRSSAGDRLGEAYVWGTLRGELDADAAWRASSGWGGDELRMVAGPGWQTANLTWAIRWDTPGDADEFAVAYDDWRAKRDVNASFRLVRVNETVTLVLAGDECFVDAANASLNGTTVVVTAENESTENATADNATAKNQAAKNAPTNATRASPSSSAFAAGARVQPPSSAIAASRSR